MKGKKIQDKMPDIRIKRLERNNKINENVDAHETSLIISYK
jgi:hypothetical protein